MNLAPSFDPCLSWWGLGGYSGPLSSGTRLLSGIRRDREEEAKQREAFVKGENWFLLLHAGAPGTDMKRVPQCPSLNLKLYILGTVPASYTLFVPCPASHMPFSLCSTPSPVFLTPCPACVPRCMFHVLRPRSLTPWIVLHALCHICCMLHSVLHTILGIPCPPLSGPAP